MICFKYIIRYISLFLVGTYSTNAHSQELNPKDSLILKQLDTVDLNNSITVTLLLKESALFHAQKMNLALTTYDFKTLYPYVPEEDLEGLSLEEFVIRSQPWKELMMSTYSSQSVVVVSESKLVSHCEGWFYCFMNQVTTEAIDGKESSRKSKLMAVSRDGIHWKFYNMGTLSSEQIKKLHPSVCDVILKD